MRILEKETAIHLCIAISTAHISSDLVSLLFPSAHQEHLLHAIEHILMVAATFALAVHVMLERTLFEWVFASAHAGNLLFAWINAGIDGVFRGAGIELPHSVVLIAAWALIAASIATLAELLGLARQPVRILLVSTLAVVGLCCAQSKGFHELLLIQPVGRNERQFVSFAT